METIVLTVFLALVVAQALWCVISPESVVTWRRRRGWPESIWSGGYFYATPSRARTMGVILCVVVLALVLGKLAYS
jgi:hypothetical protein